ncbi:MAG TPA: acetyl-CoA carboxylase biotin carboxyl carrier protein [Caulobacteraceae bacterium]|nr:acetyl-CoA carboxylase biotin carboxyl carrier protein [Caulobacteraceae bacterium]
MAEPKAPAGAIDPAMVKTLADILTETGLTEIEVEQHGLRIRVARANQAAVTYAAPPPAAASTAPAPVAPAAPAAEAQVRGDEVKSPMVGTVYLRPQPDAAPFVRIGDRVEAGQTLLIVEAMKTMNPIHAPRAGVIVAVLVDDAQPVEFGEPLVIIE